MGKPVIFIPARIGSKRLPSKNLRRINGLSLVQILLMKLRALDLNMDIVLSSDSEEILDQGKLFDIILHRRRNDLSNDNATSEDFIYDYFIENNEVDKIIMIHTICPLLTTDSISKFIAKSLSKTTLISIDRQWLEFIHENIPVNFTFSKKENSQDLNPVYRLNWAMSSWTREFFLDGYRATNQSGTYSGDVEYFEISSEEAIMIKESVDFEICKILLGKDE